MSPLEKGVELKKLLPKFGSMRALAGVIGLSEGRMRQLIKRAGPPQGGTPEPMATTGAGETPVVQTLVVAQPPPQEQLAAPQPPQQVPPARRAVGEESRPRPSANSILPNETEAIPPAGQAAGQQEDSESNKTGGGPTAPLQGGETKEMAAGDYPIKDPEVGAKLLAEWIKSNYYEVDRLVAITDFKTSRDGVRKPEYDHEASEVGDIPVGVGAEEVINLCQPPRMDEPIMHNDLNWRFKWFARWSSVLLPDPKIRSAAIELAGRSLVPPPRKWPLIYIDPKKKQPTVHLRSKSMAVADVLEKLETPLLEVIKVLPGYMPRGTPLPEYILLNPSEVEEVLRYAAATVREGRRPSED